MLATLVWVVGGGPAWAQQKAAKDNPRAFLARLAEDRRLQLTEEQRETLRAAARRPDIDEIFARLAEDERLSLTPEQRQQLKRQGAAFSPVPRKPFPTVAPSPARAMETLGDELLGKAGDAETPALNGPDVAEIAADALDHA